MTVNTFRAGMSVVLALAAVTAGGTAHASPDPDTHVTGAVDRALGRVQPGGIGAVEPFWSPNFGDAGVPGLLAGAGVRQLSFEAGPATDLYDWRTNTLKPDPDASHHSFDYDTDLKPGTSFDQFATTAKSLHANMTVHVNYGTGTAQEAADWVDYANHTRHYGVRNWEIGEESYLNGYFGFWWEPDAHHDAAGNPEGPDQWAHNALAFVTAMREADPTIKIGVPVADPAQPGIGPRAAQWNAAVLKVLGPVIDFVDVHWFPYLDATDDAELLASAPKQVAGSYSLLRQEIADGAGARASQVDVLVGETNSVALNFGKQSVSLVNAMFLVEDYLTWLEQGVQAVDWWALHNGPQFGVNNGPGLYGDAQYGDLGVLSSGVCQDTICEPAADTPFPPYYGLKLLGSAVRPGSTTVATTSDNGLVNAHAVRGPDGTVTVILVNTDRAHAHAARIALPGVRLLPGATVLSYGEQSTDVATGHEAGAPNLLRELPPYSITAVRLRPRG